jgi:hypothetical protein
MRVFVFIISISIILTMFVSSCENQPITSSTSNQTINQESTTNTEPLTTILIDGYWVLKSLGPTDNMTPAIGFISLEIKYNSSYYQGGIGPFSYGGQMSVQGNSIYIGNMTSTPITIEDKPPGLRQQAHSYLGLLRTAKTYVLNNDELQINCGYYNSLIFSRYQK